LFLTVIVGLIAGGGEVVGVNPTGLVNNTTYYWKVVPYNSLGDASNVSIWSFSTLTSSQLAGSF
jgi:hypothetical protein